jgi:hypothetical protein
MDKIVEDFNSKTGQVYKENIDGLKVREVADWPVVAGLKYGAELKDFFKWAEHLYNYHPEGHCSRLPDSIYLPVH